MDNGPPPQLARQSTENPDISSSLLPPPLGSPGNIPSPSQKQQVRITLKDLTSNISATNRVITLHPDRPTIPIGRASKNSKKGLIAAVDNAWFDSLVMSRDHAEIAVDAEGKTVTIRDIGSKHGTHLNGTELARQTPVVIDNGDILTFGVDVKHGVVICPSHKVQINYHFAPYTTRNALTLPDLSDVVVKESYDESSEEHIGKREHASGEDSDPIDFLLRESAAVDPIDLTKDDRRKPGRTRSKKAKRANRSNTEDRNTLSTIEKHAAGLVSKIKTYDWVHRYGPPSGAPTGNRKEGKHFLPNIDLFDKAELMEDLKQMPKGAYLHIHSNGGFPTPLMPTFRRPLDLDLFSPNETSSRNLGPYSNPPLATRRLDRSDMTTFTAPSNEPPPAETPSPTSVSVRILGTQRQASLSYIRGLGQYAKETIDQSSIRDSLEDAVEIGGTTSTHSDESSSPGFLVRQRGLKVLIKGRNDAAFGDTGAGQNMISDRRREELGLTMSSNPTSFPMGNSKRIFSPGTVEVPIAFEDDPMNIITIVAHVVYSFAYDLVLGNPFLKATKCLTNYIHRFVPCLFSLRSGWSMNLLGETTTRFYAHLGKGVAVLALPDIGSVRNVMNADWAIERAKAGGFKILSRPENRGWIVLPDGTEEATVGQAQTYMTLPDGKVVSMVFELLPNCYMPVVLGQDFVFDQQIHKKYSGCLYEFSDHDSGDELMPMGYRKSRFEDKKTGYSVIVRGVETDDLERQLEWNLLYHHGRRATSEEWDQEYYRREQYERGRDPTWQPGLPLIQYKPQTHDHQPSGPGNEGSNSSSGENISSTSITQIVNRNPTSSSPSHESALQNTGHPRSGNSSGEGDKGETLLETVLPLHLGDFGIDEVAQWQEEQRRSDSPLWRWLNS